MKAQVVNALPLVNTRDHRTVSQQIYSKTLTLGHQILRGNKEVHIDTFNNIEVE